MIRAYFGCKSQTDFNEILVKMSFASLCLLGLDAVSSVASSTFLAIENDLEKLRDAPIIAGIAAIPAAIGGIGTLVFSGREIYKLGVCVKAGISPLAGVGVGFVAGSVGYLTFRVLKSGLGFGDKFSGVAAAIAGIAASTLVLPGATLSIYTAIALTAITSVCLGLAVGTVGYVSVEIIAHHFTNLTSTVDNLVDSLNSSGIPKAIKCLINIAASSAVGALAAHLIAGKSLFVLGVVVASGVSFGTFAAVAATNLIVSRVWNYAFENYGKDSPLGSPLVGVAVAFYASTFILPGMMGTVLLITGVAKLCEILIYRTKVLDSLDNLMLPKKKFKSKTNYW